VREFEEALRADPKAGLTHYNLALALEAAGRWEEALKAAGQALKWKPNLAPAHALTARLLLRRGEHRAAAETCRLALAADADDLAARLLLAWLRAASPDDAVRDGAQAVALARALCEATAWQSVRCLDLLGAALAESGRYGEAAQTVEQALARLEAAERAGGAADQTAPEGSLLPPFDRAALQERLRRYAQRQPYRMTAGPAAGPPRDGASVE